MLGENTKGWEKRRGEITVKSEQKEMSSKTDTYNTHTYVYVYGHISGRINAHYIYCA